MNKTLKKTLSIILAILMIATTVPFAFAAESQLTIKMEDSFGDTWNGASISIYAVSDGVETLFETVGIETDEVEFEEYTAELQENTNYIFRWTKGKFDHECSFEILINGNTVFAADRGDCKTFEDNMHICGACYLAHTYSSDCDTECNLCLGKRTTTVDHIYSSDCGDIYCNACGYERFAHILENNGDIKNDVLCVSCGEVVYEASDRWSVGDYYGRTGNTTVMAGHKTNEDNITSYLVMDTVPGEKYNLSFAWAICQGFTEYGRYYLRFYHNGEEKILHDFTKVPNPYEKILDESYTFTAEGEQQVFKWVFEKVKSDYWATDGRPIYLDEFELKHLDHDIVVDEAVAPTCTETGLTEGSHCLYCDDATIAQEVIPALGHADENHNGNCERCQCNDCGRPVHDDNLMQNIICWFVMLINLVKSMF